MRNFKTVLNGIIMTGLGVFAMSGLVDTEVKAYVENPLEQFEEQTYDKEQPGTWWQSDTPYSGYNFPFDWGGTFGSSSCGTHSITSILEKAGYETEGETGYPVVDTYYNVVQYAGYGSAYGPCYNYENITYDLTDGKLNYYSRWDGSNVASMKDWVKNEYANGRFVIVSGYFANGYGSSNHISAVDYVNEDGDVILCDSGWRYKYIESIRSGLYAVSFESPDVNSQEAPKFTLGETFQDYLDKKEAEAEALRLEQERLRQEALETKLKNHTKTVEKLLADNLISIK